MTLIRNIILLILLICIAEEARGADLTFTGSIRMDTAVSFIKQLNLIESTNPKEINIDLNSKGGDVQAMYLMIQKIRMLQDSGIKVNFTVINECASACFTLLQSGNKRYMYKKAKLMQHMPYTFIQFGFWYKYNSNTKEIIKDINKLLKDRDKYLLQIKKGMEDIELTKLNISRKEWRKLTISNDYYMDYKKALKINAIDDIIKVKKEAYNEKTK